MRSLKARLISIATVVAMLATSCGSRAPQPPHVPSPLSDFALEQTKKLPHGLQMEVREGRSGPPAFDHTKLAPATDLSDADAAALLARAPAITAGSADAQPFALRERSQPPPRTGKTITSSFPPPPSTLLPPAANNVGAELRVLRYQPEGKVPVAPELSVTFSQPMVAVTGQQDAAATTPVKLDPQPSGKWRWIGTRTILFDPDVRFPQATTYHVSIPAGTKSATGGVLKDAAAFTFETPPPTLTSTYPPPPPSPQRLDVPMFAAFDQKIDPAAVLAHVRVTAAGKPVDVRLLTADELASKDLDKHLAAVIAGTKANEQDGRWLAFRATQPLPKDADVVVAFTAGTPGVEGPLATAADQQFAFHTYPPLAIRRAECGWDNHCPPGTPFTIEFDNPLDATAWDDGQLTIAPALPDAKIIQAGDEVTIAGDTTARTTYTVTVASAVKDEFGQTLGTDDPGKSPTGDTKLTFAVGDSEPMFFGPQGLVVVDPQAARPTFDMFTTNYAKLVVKVYRVDPSMIDAFGNYLENRWNHDHPPAMPGSKVVDTTLTVDAQANRLAETAIDLRPALDASGLGHAIVVVQPAPWHEQYPPPEVIAWVESTRLGVDAHVDADHMDVLATDLATGAPERGIAVDIRPFGITGTTDAHGMAALALPTTTRRGARYVVARKGNDTAFVAGTGFSGDQTEVWMKQPRSPQLAWYVTDDRGMYKPGEGVALKGWLRAIDNGKGGDVGGIAGAVSTVGFTVRDSRGNQIGNGSAKVNAAGGFDAKLTLPKTPNLGYTVIDFVAQGRMTGSYQHAIQVEEFRTPEFEVTAHAGEGPFVVGGGGDLTATAKYYAGGPLGGAPAQWSVVATPTSYTPPGRDDYTFGSWTPWWGGPPDSDDDDDASQAPAQSNWSLTGKTDATGTAVIHMDFLSLNPAMPMSLMASVAVTDVNRQQWAAQAVALVHPSERYVGLKPQRPFVERGQPYQLDVIGVDLDGKPAVGAAIELTSVRVDWTYKRGRMRRVETDAQTCAVTAAADPATCKFDTAKGGMYQVRATIVDAKGRPNQTTLIYWVAGGEVIPARDLAQERVELIPDKKSYADGDTAEILVQAPFYPAEALVSWRRSGIVKTERMTLAGPTATIKVPIVDAMVPNLIVQVDLVGATTRSDDHGQPDPRLPKRPAYAVGSLDLPVPPKQRVLAVTVVPAAAKVAPGEQTRVAVDVRDAQGRPVAGSEVAVIVVDDAILALTGKQFVDPTAVFYAERGAGANDYYERQYVSLARPKASAGGPGGLRFKAGVDGRGEVFAEADEAMPPPAPPVPEPTPMPKEAPIVVTGTTIETKDATTPGPQQTPIAIRSNFNPLAAFAPSVDTDGNGHADVAVKMPDNLTRYRIVAVAVAGAHQFGKAESAVTARLPLMVRPSPPRFLNFGDTFRLPVVVQNQTDQAMTVRVVARASNAAITGAAGREVTVPANDRVEVQFPAAAREAGTARFQVVAASGSYQDASELALPVWTPATTEAFATYGVIDDGAIRQPVALPGKVWPQFGGLEVTTAATNLQALTDAMLYLVHYPYECAEQRSSRILAIAALRDVLTAFKTNDMPSPAAMEASVAADIEHLSQMQNYDGGFAFWDRGYPSEPYLSVFVASALGHARAKGFAVPKHMFDAVAPYLKDIEDHIPAFYPDDVRHAISAYALYTRKQLGDLDVAKGKRLFAQWGGAEKVSMETDGWLLGLFAGNADVAAERVAIARFAQNHVSETAGAANFTTGYSDGNHLLLASDRRVDAVMLESLIEDQPKLDLIPKIVTGLLAHRKAGRWLNTQENSFALVALDLYFQTYEKVTPNFVARVWLGDAYAGDHAFRGRTTEYAAIDVAMKDVAKHDKQDLTIQKDGAGRLYYRVGMTYAPEDLKIAPADYGFVVERRYEPVDDPGDVTRAADGAWHIKAGARVRVRVTMVNENRRYQVALVDPIPAGLEAMNPALAVTGPIPLDPKEQASRGPYWWWLGPWYEHQNLRDERVEAFAALLWEGVHDYSYVARATTPGSYVVPPPKAEEMYMPETFGRGGTDRVVVE